MFLWLIPSQINPFFLEYCALLCTPQLNKHLIGTTGFLGTYVTIQKKSSQDHPLKLGSRQLKKNAEFGRVFVHLNLKPSNLDISRVFVYVNLK